MKLVYKEDESGKQLLVDESGVHQVMMEWEKPYMEACIEKLDPSGSVLEIGFGLAYSATAICSNPNVKEYTVIECSPVVWEKFDAFKTSMAATRPELKCNIIKGRWQDVLCTAGQYDAVFFDDYIDVTAQHANFWRFSEFLLDTVTEHMSIGARISWFSGKGSFPVPENQFLLKESDNYDIEVPKHCNYRSRSGYDVPLLTKLKDCTVSDLKSFLSPWADQVVQQKAVREAQDNQRQAMEHWNSLRKSRDTTRTPLILIDNYFSNASDVAKYGAGLFDNSEKTMDPSGLARDSDVSDSEKEFLRTYLQKVTKVAITGDIKAKFVRLDSTCQNYIRFGNACTWTAIVFLSQHASQNSGISTAMWEGRVETYDEVKALQETTRMLEHRIDPTRWTISDKIAGIFNRMVLLEGGRFYKFSETFGVTPSNSQLALIYELG